MPFKTNQRIVGHGSMSARRCDIAFSVGRPKFSQDPTDNVSFHGIGLDDDLFDMGAFAAPKRA